MAKKLRTLKDIENDPRVDSIHKENDGFNPNGGLSYWCYLKKGYIVPDMECGTIHECTVKEVIEMLDTAVPEWQFWFNG